MDPMHFTAADILEMAVRVEENGLVYYTVAAEAARSPQVKDLFDFLAKEEKNHIEFFSSLMEPLPAGEPTGAFDPYIEEESLYLAALADSSVFTEDDWGKRLAGEVQDEADALRRAIEVEKDSILFYHELRNMVREKDRDVLDKIIIEEREHLSKLSAMKRKIKG
jgi:rubrerythrin